jgi:hypothetical protein
MSDRYHGLTVVLEKDFRDDDCEVLLAAIRQLRGVASVTGHVADFDSHMAEERARLKLGKELLGICFPAMKEERR